MTYGRVRVAGQTHPPDGADVSHAAEPVRGDLRAYGKAPSSGPLGHLLPKGRRDVGARIGGAA